MTPSFPQPVLPARRGQRRTINHKEATGGDLPSVAADLNLVAETLCTNLPDKLGRQSHAVDLDGRMGSEAENNACRTTGREHNRANHSDDEAPRHRAQDVRDRHLQSRPVTLRAAS